MLDKLLHAGICLALLGLSACGPSFEERMATPAVAPHKWVKKDARFYEKYGGQMETFSTAFGEVEGIVVNGVAGQPVTQLLDQTSLAQLKISAFSRIYGLQGIEKNPALGAIELETLLRYQPENLPPRNDLGVLYLSGNGVNQDFRRAREHFLAAAPVSSEALFNLALMHYNGFGVPVNHIEAHKWLTLSTTCTTRASPGYEAAVPARDTIAAVLSEAQLAESLEGVNQWLSRNAKPLDRNAFCNPENAAAITAMLRAEQKEKRAARNAERAARDAERARNTARTTDRSRRRSTTSGRDRFDRNRARRSRRNRR